MDTATESNHAKRVWISTFGCQMNENDSQKMLRLLKRAGYEPTEHAEEADLALVNTCSIREKADQKALSLLGRLQKLRSEKPNFLVGVCGCMAQLQGDSLLKKHRLKVDLVIGTHAISRLPSLVHDATKKRSRQLDIEFSERGEYDFLPVQAEDLAGNRNVTSFVTISNGCHHRCSYCIVPYSRGREDSRQPDDILQEIETLAQAGVKEVTLLGQIVTSYGRGSDYRFAHLLRDANAIDGIERIRYVTSHPSDINDEIARVFAECEKVCEHLHLPVQVGSDRILRKMFRGYTVDSYLKRIELLRSYKPNISLSTDIIVGFPGETEEDFEGTMQLMKTVGFDSSFSFKYSPRPGTPSAGFPQQVPEAEAGERLQRLQKLQAKLTEAKRLENVGQSVEVLVEGPSKEGAGQLTGRTRKKLGGEFQRQTEPNRVTSRREYLRSPF